MMVRKDDGPECVPVGEAMLIGGRLCLDFVNTANYDGEAVVDEKLTGYGALLVWSERLGLIDAEGVARLAEQAAAAPDQAEEALASALSLRAALRRLFTETGADPEADLARLDRAASCVRLRRLGPRRYALAPGEDLSGWLCHGVGASAVELLTSDRLARVKMCSGDSCGWLFLDESPSGRRRWCSMATCGNRHKAKAHYGRRKAAE